MRNKRKHVLTLILFCSLVFSIRAQQQHPYLFFTPDRIATLKEQLKSDKEVKANYAQVEQVAREALKEKNPYRKLEYLALAYQVTGEKRYADKIKESIRQTGGKETLEAKDMLNREPAWTSLLSTPMPIIKWLSVSMLSITNSQMKNGKSWHKPFTK